MPPPPAGDAAVTARWRPGRTVLALSAVSLLTDLASAMVAPLLPVFLTGTLGVSVRMVGAIEGSADAMAAALKLGSGWWSDRVARRKLLIVAGYAVASLVRPLVALAQSGGQVLAIRLVDRMGKGIRGAPRDALLAADTPVAHRGAAFGFHRGADHLGAALGPLVAFLLLSVAGIPLRTLFWLTAIPGALAVLIAVVFVREARTAAPGTSPRNGSAGAASASREVGRGERTRLPGRFWGMLGVLLLFTLGNATDAFLLLRAQALGVPVALLPLLWGALHVVKSASSAPGGALSDRVGRRPLLIAGWLLYAAVYAGFSAAHAAWQAWALFAVYGVVFGLTEGTEKALVADLAPAPLRGRAFGWYHAVIGLGALPASVFFGTLWESRGAPTAFLVGAGLALGAALALCLPDFGDASAQQQREPGRL